MTNCEAKRSTRRALQVQQYHASGINECIAAAAMVWHDCLLTTKDELLFTGHSERDVPSDKKDFSKMNKCSESRTIM